VGQFSLATQGTDSVSYEHSFQATETAVLSPKAINETRFRWLYDTSASNATDVGTTVNVAGAEVTDGSSTPYSKSHLTNMELQNYTTLTEGANVFKFGLRIRSYQDYLDSPSNFNGTWTFAGGPGETSLVQYQQAQLGLASPSQFSITGGNPVASIAELDAGLFFQDDWRVRPNLTLNFGLRYEIQNEISDFKDIAPRFGFAWSPDSKGTNRARPSSAAVREFSTIASSTTTRSIPSSTTASPCRTTSSTGLRPRVRRSSMPTRICQPRVCWLPRPLRKRLIRWPGTCERLM